MIKRSGYFFLLWIVLLAVSLLITITITQIVTQNSLSRLRQGNQQAITTFTMNNRLQEMVNLAFELESKMLTGQPAALITPKRGIKDSLTRLQYNIGVLEKLWGDTVQVTALNKLVLFIDNQVEVSFRILTALEKNNMVLQKSLSDSLRESHWGDSIYTSAILFQKGLEQNLGATLAKNNKAASQLSVLNRLLAGLALVAVLVLATINIRRQVKQLSLIKDLKEARKVALQSVEVKDQFLANMSHEIRTPLNAIKGFGKILMQTSLNAEQQKYTSIISTASDNLLNIVNDILDFSKIEAGNLVMKKKAFQVAGVVNEVELMFAALAQEKNLRLFFSVDTQLPAFVKGDPERLRQILVNLVSNAIKFTNEGKVSLEVKLTEDKAERIKIKFTVADTGVGIPYENTGIIFERFEQLDHSYTRQQGGTGLGLAITKKLVEAMGGKIMVKSEVNRGSVFTIELEFEKIISSATEQEVVIPVRENENISLSNRRILVAEDNKMNQLLVKNMLDNYEVITDIVDNGEDAIKALKENKYDLVLMDVQMPKTDGITATRLIREGIDAVTPVIAMTAHVLTGEKEKCMDAGMNDYLSKPLDENEVISMLKKYIALPVENTFSINSSTNIEWLNIIYLKSICGNDQRRIIRILSELQKQLPQDIHALKNAVMKKEVSEIKRVCHHLKSTLSPFSASSAPVIIFGELNNLLQGEVPETAIISKVSQLITQLGKAAEELGIFLEEYHISG